MTTDWGGDYSFLIHSIEERLSEHIPDRENASPTRGSDSSLAKSPESGRKRRRLSEDRCASPSARYEESNHSSRIEISGSLGAADKLKQTVELDELRLLNEQLRDQVKSLEDDFHRYKEKTLKQLTFMESENSQLKKTANEKNDRYYEEKKKSQAKIRTLEAELATLRDSSLLDSSTMRGVSSGSASASSSGASGWEDKLADLEYNITAKTNESKTLAKRCSEFEEINRKQQQEILLLKARLGRNVDSISVVESASSGDGGDGESGETLLSLKRKCSELETSLRRKSRELERVEQKVKNQALMEEELSSAEAKLKRTQEALERAKAVETGYQAMQDEKKEWNVLFRDIVAGSAGSGDVAVTPAMVLRTLSATQQKCAALLKSQGELEASNSELRKQLLTSSAALRTASADKEEAFRQTEQLSTRLRLASQQASLYEGEVLSLRALIQSYDAEYKIGRNVTAGSAGAAGAAGAAAGKSRTDDLLRMKDEMITGLRTELDKCRKEGRDLASRLDEEIKRATNLAAPSAPGDVKVKAEGSVSATVSDAAAVAGGEEDAKVTIASLQQREKSLVEQLSQLKEEMFALQQFSGVDYIPAKTKIIHMIDNPASAAMTSARALLQTQTSTLPKEQIRALKKLNQQLTTELETRPTANDDSSADRSTGRQTNMNMMDQSMNMTTAGAEPTSSAASAADSSKLNQRLKEMFKERITSFREAVYLLTGYKVDLYAADASTGGHARLRLRSMYAENPDDSLLFQWRGDNLELMETPFASKLDSKLFAYLSTCNSVPAFLSNVTLELFDNQTFLG